MKVLRFGRDRILNMRKGKLVHAHALSIDPEEAYTFPAEAICVLRTYPFMGFGRSLFLPEVKQEKLGAALLGDGTLLVLQKGHKADYRGDEMSVDALETLQDEAEATAKMRQMRRIGRVTDKLNTMLAWGFILELVILGFMVAPIVWPKLVEAWGAKPQ